MMRRRAPREGVGRRRRRGIALALCLAAAGLGCARRRGADAAVAFVPAATVLTADIRAGIERHVEQEIARGGGFFRLPFKDRELKLKLVRVHTEYLSNLGPGRHFACVDLVDVTGDVYDVDFFLEGEPGAMRVTETTVHKINGQPYYVWDQRADKSWYRIPVEAASDAHFGVVRGRDEFEFRYWARLPPMDAPARLWLPLPQSDPFQTVEIRSLDLPVPHRIVRDAKHGNRVIFAELTPADGGKTIDLRFAVRRLEKPPHAGDPPVVADLAPEARVPITDEFRATAREVTAGLKDDLMRARALYDHVIDRMRYMKHGEGWGQGDAQYACDIRTGNCTDFHAYFMALARSIGIPARFAIGAGIPADRDEGGIDGYHCWVEFHADGKWWPVDISEADKYSALATYYFGRHPANRLEFSRGRDLLVDPLPASGPINFLAYPVIEVDGQPARAEVSFSFRRPPRP